MFSEDLLETNDLSCCTMLAARSRRQSKILRSPSGWSLMHYPQSPVTKKSCQQIRLRIHWLLLLSVLLQSVAPTLWATSSALVADSEIRNSEKGIWTISCAGKPMWLALPQQTEPQTAFVPGATNHSENALHCLICSNLTGTDLLPSAPENLDFRLSTAAIACIPIAAALAANQIYQCYYSRAPPVLQV